MCKTWRASGEGSLYIIDNQQHEIPVLGTKKALIITGYESLFYFTLSNNLTLSLLATPKVGTHMKNNAKKARSWWLSPA